MPVNEGTFQTVVRIAMGSGAASRIGAAPVVRPSHRAITESEAAVKSKKPTKQLKKSMKIQPTKPLVRVSWRVDP